jgi:hypothetical protein
MHASGNFKFKLLEISELDLRDSGCQVTVQLEIIRVRLGVFKFSTYVRVLARSKITVTTLTES